MKNESSGIGSRPHETQLTTAAEPQRKTPNLTVAVKRDTSYFKVIFVYLPEPENDTQILNESSIRSMYQF